MDEVKSLEQIYSIKVKELGVNHWYIEIYSGVRQVENQGFGRVKKIEVKAT